MTIQTTTTQTFTRGEALDQIDAVRATLTHADAQMPALICIIRDLWDGYPLADALADAHRLLLGDYPAEQRIKAIVAATVDND